VEYTDRFVRIFEQATPTDRRLGRVWYPDAWDIAVGLARGYGYPAPHVAAAISALSPMVRWDLNVEYTRSLLRSVRDGIIEPQLPVFKSNVKKAINALDIGVDALLGAPKTTEFTRGICLEPDAAVVDRWIARACGYTGRLNKKTYDIVAQPLREAACMCGEDVAPFQATVWIMVRSPQRDLFE